MAELYASAATDPLSGISGMAILAALFFLVLWIGERRNTGRWRAEADALAHKLAVSQERCWKLDDAICEHRCAVQEAGGPVRPEDDALWRVQVEMSRRVDDHA
mgnify:CR=1 FL=1